MDQLSERGWAVQGTGEEGGGSCQPPWLLTPDFLTPLLSATLCLLPPFLCSGWPPARSLWVFLAPGPAVI